jgi:L-threonylcarbamoyladenylate synthase
LFPTDTLYGLGADAMSNDAVDKIYAIKGRDEGKPIHALVRDIEMAERYAEITSLVREVMELLPTGKVTFICKKKAGLETGIARGIDTFGFRIPESEFCLAMIEQFGGPVTATSANVAGQTPQRSVDAILEQFQYSNIPQNIGVIDLVVDGGELPPSQPSTVISFAGAYPEILREGAVSAADVRGALLEFRGE